MVFACIGLWIVSFPAYLVTRPKYKQLAASRQAFQVQTLGPARDFEAELTKLARLRDAKIITETEFNDKKKTILNQISDPELSVYSSNKVVFPASDVPKPKRPTLASSLIGALVILVLSIILLEILLS